jgi:hypothetical protein
MQRAGQHRHSSAPGDSHSPALPALHHQPRRHATESTTPRSRGPALSYGILGGQWLWAQHCWPCSSSPGTTTSTACTAFLSCWLPSCAAVSYRPWHGHSNACMLSLSLPLSGWQQSWGCAERLSPPQPCCSPPLITLLGPTLAGRCRSTGPAGRRALPGMQAQSAAPEQCTAGPAWLPASRHRQVTSH